MNYITESLAEAKKLIDSFFASPAQISLVEASIEAMTSTLNHEGKILACGNGGSMCDSLHFAEELTGRFRKDRPALSALALADPAHMSCVAKDFGYQFIFSRMVEALGKKGDILLAISTSGNSLNVIEAAKIAKQKSMKIISLLGKDGGQLKDISDYSIIIPTQSTERIQEMHIKIIHIFIEGIERKLFPQLY